MGLRLQDEVRFVASLGSIKADCMESKKATFYQRYQQVMSFKPLWPLVPQMQRPCASAACLLRRLKDCPLGVWDNNLEITKCLVNCAMPGISLIA